MIPPQLLVHTVTVEPYKGRSSVGSIFGEPFALRCMRQGGDRLVRDTDGSERVSSVTLYAEPGQAALIPPGSRVQLDNGATTTVMRTVDHDSGSLGAPDHTEVVCE